MGLQSRKIAWGTRDGGFPVCVFEALAELSCIDCGRTISVGEHFTRATRGFRTTQPICLSCRPVAELPAGKTLSRVERGRLHASRASH